MGAGILSLAVAFPRCFMPNAYWVEHHPDMVARAESSPLSRAFRPSAAGPTLAIDTAMLPYASDPFRGCVDRWWLGEGETALSLELEAARAALSACDLTPRDIDLAIVGSFFPDELDTGNAAFLAATSAFPGRLGTSRPRAPRA